MGSIGVNRDSIRLSFLDTTENVGQTNNADKTGHYDDFRFSSMDSSTAPTKSSSIGEKFKAGIKTIHHKIADSFIGKALGKVESKILSFVADVKERRLENKTELLKTSPEGAKIVKSAESSTFDSVLDAVKPHGSAGVRVLAEGLLTAACKDRVGDGPLDPDNEQDKQIIDKLTANVLAPALSQNPGGGQTIDAARKQISEFTSMIVGAHTKSTPDSLKSLLTVFNKVSSLLADGPSLKEFLAERLETDFVRMAGNGAAADESAFEKTFMRANATISVLTARVGGEGLYAGLDDVKKDVHAVLDMTKNLQKAHRSIGDNTDATTPLTKEQQAEARVDLDIQILDAAIGKNGEKVIERLGEDGKAQLQETGRQIMRLAKEQGFSNEFADIVVRKYYQNVIFLRGISPQVTAAYGNNPESSDFDPLGSKVVTNAIKDLTILFNELDPMTSNSLSQFPELQTALTTTDIPGRLLKLYDDLGIPKTEQFEQADAIETAEKLGAILRQGGDQPNNVGDVNLHTDELNALLRSIDNPEVHPEGDYEVEGQIDNDEQGDNANPQVSSNVPVEQRDVGDVRRKTVVEPTVEGDDIEEDLEHEETTASENNALLVELRQRVLNGEKLEPTEQRLLQQLERLDIGNRAN